MSTPLIAVTGATGKIGGAVAEQLRDAGLAPRLLVRDVSRAPAWAGDVSVADYGNEQDAVQALSGVDLLFMVSAAESEDRLEQHRIFIAAAARAGVKHVVYTSFLGASPQATFTLARTHWYTEEALRDSGMGYTFLRDSFYTDFFIEIGAEGSITGPAGGGRVGAVARADVAAAAAAILKDLATGDRRHDGATYDLTGPQAFTMEEAAQIMTEVTGRRTVYHEETVEEAYASRAHYDVPDWEKDAWVSTYTAIATGELDVVSDAVERLTGRHPLSLRDLLSQPRP
ncbi:SDR family oxidoreductase [Actinomyces sp. ZJ308]|uniref:SDR family oxidoreductase n=1 Tax=Actinomyces sp. ZJ308 TaxID=2708342 RepID=UPI001421A36F|nr:SDR family oxidoreductase [Actinomyces sp. ZJ308]